MRDREKGSSIGNAPDNNYDVGILREIYHSEPGHRCLAALNRWGLDVLKNDEVWLVRHCARRMLRRQELEEAGVDLSPGDVRLINAHISDLVYELYKVDWMNKNTTPQTRMQSTRDWCNIALRHQRDAIWPKAYDCWLEEVGYLLKDGQSHGFYDSLPEFLGFMKPDCQGIYHNREYVAELLGHDEKLLALYDADINDDKELYFETPSIGDRLADAAERSAQARHSHTSKDEFTLA